MRTPLITLTISQLIARDAEIGNALDRFFAQAAVDRRTWAANRPRRQSLLSQRRECAELNARHLREAN